MSNNNQPNFDPLQAFANWWSQNGTIIHTAPIDGITRFGGVSVLTLYRDREFQVQLAICDPGFEITDHRHPGVELIKVYISGEIFLRVNGKPVITREKMDAAGGALNGVAMRMGPDDVHGATIGPKGGAFMTIQRHLGGDMKSLGLKWDGPALNEAHAKALERDRNPSLRHTANTNHRQRNNDPTPPKQ